MKAAVFFGALGLALLRCCTAAWTSGSAVVRPNSTVFLSKFCFSFNTEGRHLAGLVDVRVRASKVAPVHHVHLALLDDELDSYPGSRSEWDAMTCQQRLRHAKHTMFIDWQTAALPDGQEVDVHINQKLRPRWWYLVLLDCTDDEGAPDSIVEYEARFTNLQYGTLGEFSTDRRHTLPFFVLLTAAYAAMAIAQGTANEATGRTADDDSATGKAAHPFTRTLSGGILVGLLAVALFVVHSLAYMLDGVGAPALAVLAQILSTASNFVLASLLLLVSEGKCVSYIMVAGDARRMFRLLGPFLVACCCLELWGEYSVRQKYSTDYVYTTPFGWALILVDLTLLARYASSMRSTFLAEKERDGGHFYCTWGILFGVWFLALPVTALLAQAVLAPYVWFIVSLVVKQGATAIVYGALMVGLWPGNTRTYFKLESAEDEARKLTASAKWRSPTGQRTQPLLPAPKRMPVLLGRASCATEASQGFPLGAARQGTKAEGGVGRKPCPSMSP
mmetsp:Transcript_85517/g.246855  ORF Transcript_85517/g.246855 Transcript_85517/m.246855 type:complete len:504 (-) Transcript_85517:118-1629(-)